MEGGEGDAPARPRNSINSCVFSSCSAYTVPKPRKRPMYDSSHQRPCCAPLPLRSSRKPHCSTYVYASATRVLQPHQLAPATQVAVTSLA